MAYDKNINMSVIKNKKYTPSPNNHLIIICQQLNKSPHIEQRINNIIITKFTTLETVPERIY